MISTARFCASCGVNDPVICVVPPEIPTSQAIDSSTCGEEMISLSRTMATRRLWSPGGAQAAFPVSSRQGPGSLKSIVTNQPGPA
ncbi:hypothetical protein GCM10027612_51750 [Microbispora bryophytorum subsp. camponoti]